MKRKIFSIKILSILFALVLIFSMVMLMPVQGGEPTMHGNPFAPNFTFVPGYPLPEGILIEKNVHVEMLDGTQLACDIFRPDKPGEFPVIMSFTSWDKDLWGLVGLGTIGYTPSEACAFEAADPGFWVPNDYAVVLFDKRGYGQSEGQRGYNEREDYYIAIEWVAAQEWCDGNIGMNGVSSLASCQYYAASQQPPHLKAICVWGGSSAYPTSRFGGIPETAFMVQASRMAPPLNPDLNQTEGPRSPITLEDLQNITVPGIFTAQWTDQELHLGGTIWAYDHVSSEYKWLYTHGEEKWGGFYGPAAVEYQKRFFDYFLKGVDNGMLEVPRVRLDTRETLYDYSVRYENEWPIPDTEYTKLYLDANTGTLNFDEVAEEGEVTYDSTFTYTRASFDIKFDQDTEVTGHMSLHLWVSPEDKDDMDIFVTVRKLNVHGAQVFFEGCHAPGRNPVALGWLRLSNRELNEEFSTPWWPIYEFGDPQTVEPGDIVPCDIAIYPTSTLFRAGETLRVLVSGKYLVQTGELGNPFWGFDDLNVGNHSVYTGGQYDSYLLVPIVEPPSPVTVEVRIKPDTLNLSGEGLFTASIIPPTGYSAEDIDVSTVKCNGAAAVSGTVAAGRLEAKFNTQDLVIVPTDNQVELTVTGQFYPLPGYLDGIPFEGSDTIRVMMTGEAKISR